MNTLVIRADANTAIGTGHVMRCLALVQAWQDRGGRAVFVSSCQSNGLKERLISENIAFVPLERVHPDPRDCEVTLSVLKGINAGSGRFKVWLVADGYHFDAGYQRAIKEAGFNLLWMDDYGHASRYHADLVLNQNISAGPSLYACREPYTELLLGPRYAVLRREFKPWRGMTRQIAPTARRLLVTLGGADADNVTLKVLQALKRLPLEDLEARIVVGPANPHEASLRSEIGASANVQLLTNAADMPGLMAWADVAVAAGGSTSWELAFMGLPQVVIPCAENQKANGEALNRERMGVNLGWHQSVSAGDIAAALHPVMMSGEVRSLMSRQGRRRVDGRGGDRVCRMMMGQTLRLRSMLPEDCTRVWQWANDPSVRAVSFSREPIPWEDHVRWFADRINRPFFYLALNREGCPVGQVRFDEKEGEMVISLMIDVSFRRGGYGAELIDLACEELFRSSSVASIHAYVRRENGGSRRAFLAAGFDDMTDEVSCGHAVRHFARRRS